MGPFRCPVIPRVWLNMKSCTELSGTTIAAQNLANLPAGKEFCCNATAGGYFVSSWYMLDYDGSRLICTDGPIYDHLSDGLQRSIIFDEMCPRQIQFETSIAGSGTIVDDDVDGGISLSTGNTNDSSARININGAKVDLTKPLMLRWKMELTDADSVLARIGIGMTAVTTSSHGNQSAVGLEIDSSDDVDLFWTLRSGSGLQTSGMLTENYPLGSNNTYRYVLLWIPNDGIYLYANQILVAYKDYDLPNGITSSSRWFSAGVRNREPDNKTMNIRSLHIYAANGEVY